MTAYSGCSSQDAVLATTELLEQILLYLPMQTLLHAQRVDRWFHTIINTSLALQQALFFRPTPSEGSEFRRSSDAASGNLTRLEVQLNPLLYQHFPGLFTLADQNYSDFYHQLTWHKAVDWDVYTGRRGEEWSREEASWRKMLLCQPALEELNIKESMSTMMGLYRREGNILFCGASGVHKHPRNGDADRSENASDARFKYWSNPQLDDEDRISCSKTEPFMTAGAVYDLITDRFFGGGGPLSSKTLHVSWLMFQDQDNLNQHVKLGDKANPVLRKEIKQRTESLDKRIRPEKRLVVEIDELVSCIGGSLADEELGEGPMPRGIFVTEGIGLLDEIKELFAKDFRVPQRYRGDHSDPDW